jgi:hypothetical protein
MQCECNLKRIGGTAAGRLCPLHALLIEQAVAATVPTRDAYSAACRALAHWRKEAKRLARIARVKPREMNQK